MVNANGDRSRSKAQRRRRVRAPVRREIIPSTLVATRRNGIHAVSAEPTNGAEPTSDVARGMLVDYLKLLSWWLGRPPTPELTPRLAQALDGLLRGRSEKQIAGDLRVSLHTAHGYVKELHRRFNVTSRSELLVRFLPSARAGRAGSNPA